MVQCLAGFSSYSGIHSSRSCTEAGAAPHTNISQPMGNSAVPSQLGSSRMRGVGLSAGLQSLTQSGKRNMPENNKSKVTRLGTQSPPKF